MKKFAIVFVVFAAYSIPIFAYASIVISEVAWMGSSSQYEEWIELYNSGSNSVSLDGWNIYKIGNVKLIGLSGSIPASGYALVCRTTGTVTNPLGGICTQTGAFGGSGLNNSSEQIVLKDSAGSTVDSVDATSGWPAGDASTKETMQLSGSTWITATGTPKAQNAAAPAESDPEDQDPQDEPDPDNDSDPQPETHHGSGKVAKGIRTTQVDPNPVYTATLVTAPDYTMRGVPTTFEAKVSKDKPWIISISGRYTWSMGDGSSYTFRKNTPVVHTYQHPGTYTVVFRYYSAWLKEKPDSIHMKKITILDDTVTITKVSGSDDIRVMNKTDQELDLRGWTFRSPQGSEYDIPAYTFVPKQGEIIIPSSVIGFPAGLDVLLENPNGNQISSTIPIISMPVSRGTVWYSRKESTKNSIPLESSNPNMTEGSKSVLGAQVPESKRSFPLPLAIGVFLAAVSGYAAYRYTNPHPNPLPEGEGVSEHELYDLEELLDEDE